MRFRSSNVRTKIVALLLSLFALWVFAAYVTLREGVNLLSVSTLDSNVAQHTDLLIPDLQQERLLSLAYLADPDAQRREQLDAARARVDTNRAAFEKTGRSAAVRAVASDELEQRIDGIYAALERLGPSREAIDRRGTDREQAATTFTDAIGSILYAYDSLATLDDKELAGDVRTLIELVRAREVIAQEQALVAGALTAGKLTQAEHERFVQLVGAHRFYSELAAGSLPAEDHARYDDMVDGTAYRTFRGLEERLIRNGRAATPPVSASEWESATAPVLAEYQDVIITGGDALLERVTPSAIWVFVRLVLAGGLGLVALIASIVMSITTARAILAQLERLRIAASDLANKRLPGVVERLRQGEKVDVAAEAPPLTFGSDEIGQVGQAINAVQETAIRVAVEQAELRNGVRDLFLGLARRNQALVHRQLTVLDEIERRENDPQELAELFKVDHLATRMRRNAENLIVLSGSVPGRRWRNPVPFVDVVRGAVAEVEDYTRVSVLPIDAASLAGRAVSDVIHLLAELIENAASFSPPYTMVNVGGQKVANGFVVEIEDRGLGMKDEELVSANELVRNPPDFNLSSTARLGLFVVGRLAERHSIDVKLRRSPYGGTTAIVLIPSVLVVSDQEAGAPPVTADPVPASPPAPIPVGAGKRDEAETQSLPVVEKRPELDRRPRTYQPLRAAPPPVEQAEPPPRAPQAVPSQPVQPAQPATPPSEEAPRLTPSGLPWRVRQASLAAPLREEPPAAQDPSDGLGRSPDETRDMMASYQAATRRGREAARRLSVAPQEEETAGMSPPEPPTSAGPETPER
ncbi:nitrate- and nitrite sensing domain-containing protein [Micromonospora sp. CPCC 205371]|nr:nitrate- and nitrite sensing domain-containing protein [Micromonospora sp. CPCC 205371]